ncbi:hypothetical protein [Methylobacterium sp. 17Sr1-1]|nr:hypothetical protein [Methylobacterium sp. 17Sr1-1]
MRQDRRSVTVHRRNPEGGFSVMACTETVDLPEIGVALSFEPIYDDARLA